jgi:hypothetical protein
MIFHVPRERVYNRAGVIDDGIAVERYLAGFRIISTPQM